MKIRLQIISIALALLLMAQSASAQVRIKDIVSIENNSQYALIGYGLVVGLSGSGDRTTGTRGSVFTVQSISNMLERFGITVPAEQMRTRNVAAVMITANMPSFARTGARFDITVSSLGDASSLEGGVLLMTPMMAQDGGYYATAQGPVSIGGYNIETDAGEKLRKNHALVGRVPGGATLNAVPPNLQMDTRQPLKMHLVEPDFVTASRIANQINQNYNNTESADSSGSVYARAVGPGLVEVSFPPEITTPYQAISVVAEIETLMVQPDVEARVVINERTGTIVAGGTVTVGEVMISHGNLTIHTQQRPIISQPGPFSNGGQTVVAPVTSTQAYEAEAKTAVISQTTTVTQLSEALNSIGLRPRDIISIFQAIKEAGALRAKLIII
jgi:flagellar P-ring protein precursor FlgI